ncbi:hypothetical protein [Actinomadura rugatobispora]|uniref:Uncharacterized protein n=1 Tax=Actinomadura rugatobispora TaxID=1994 RepID=A0ABW1AD96_9ACTN
MSRSASRVVVADETARGDAPAPRVRAASGMRAASGVRAVAAPFVAAGPSGVAVRDRFRA